jgi:hypothetical protein
MQKSLTALASFRQPICLSRRDKSIDNVGVNVGICHDVEITHSAHFNHMSRGNLFFVGTITTSSHYIPSLQSRKHLKKEFEPCRFY